MTDLWPIQQAIYSALSAVPATYPAYDAVPQGAAYPYIVIGEWTNESDDELEAASSDATVLLHAWSKTAGKIQAHAILTFIRARLDNVNLSGTWACFEEFSEVMEDPLSTAASRLYHAVARYRVKAG